MHMELRSEILGAFEDNVGGLEGCFDVSLHDGGHGLLHKGLGRNGIRQARNGRLHVLVRDRDSPGSLIGDVLSLSNNDADTLSIVVDPSRRKHGLSENDVLATRRNVRNREEVNHSGHGQSRLGVDSVKVGVCLRAEHKGGEERVRGTQDVIVVLCLAGGLQEGGLLYHSLPSGSLPGWSDKLFHGRRESAGDGGCGTRDLRVKGLLHGCKESEVASIEDGRHKGRPVGHQTLGRLRDQLSSKRSKSSRQRSLVR
mmetsp:Transcript_7695/g.17782  ORF Transcript_7695/g.17782 Transcript_7695/m.17782 type:complete len:255 (+) Transcript_7695:1968-2732(+)